MTEIYVCFLTPPNQNTFLLILLLHVKSYKTFWLGGTALVAQLLPPCKSERRDLPELYVWKPDFSGFQTPRKRPVLKHPDLGHFNASLDRFLRNKNGLAYAEIWTSLDKIRFTDIALSWQINIFGVISKDWVILNLNYSKCLQSKLV